MHANIGHLAHPLRQVRAERMWPAMALRFTYPTPRSSLSLVRARYGAQARGVTDQYRQKLKKRS